MSQNAYIKKLKSELDDVEATIKEFELNPLIIKYNKLLLEKKELENEMTLQICRAELGKIKKCNHYIMKETNLFKPTIKYCVKCGLSTDVLDSYSEELNELDRVRYDYLKENGLVGTDEGYCCDFALANEIYKRIKQSNPNIDDETAIKYLEIALDNMINIKVSDEKIDAKAKKLGVNRRSILSIRNNHIKIKLEI